MTYLHCGLNIIANKSSKGNQSSNNFNVQSSIALSVLL